MRRLTRCWTSVWILSLLCALSALAQTAATAGPLESGHATPFVGITPGKIFTYFMVMLGPFKLLGPFVKITAGMDRQASQELALKGFVIASLAGLAAAFVGRSVLVKWQISLAALLLTAGLVLLLIALQAVLAQFSHQGHAEAVKEPEIASKNLAFSPLAFPHIITPYGTAALILLAGAAPDQSRIFAILGIFLAVMVLNLLAMWFARPILKHGAGVLTLLGAVLGVLQVALAVQMLLAAGRMLHVLQ